MSAVRELFVRQAVVDVLTQCGGLLLLEATLMNQVNLTLAPAASSKEIALALETLCKKARVEWEVDPEDARLKKWRIRK